MRLEDIIIDVLELKRQISQKDDITRVEHHHSVTLLAFSFSFRSWNPPNRAVRSQLLL